MKGIIKEGALIQHDHACFIWPACKPPLFELIGVVHEYQWDETAFPDAVFDIELEQGSTCVCRRAGYGIQHDYGNGAIRTEKSNVEFL